MKPKDWIDRRTMRQRAEDHFSLGCLPKATKQPPRVDTIVQDVGDDYTDLLEPETRARMEIRAKSQKPDELF